MRNEKKFKIQNSKVKIASQKLIRQLAD